MKDENEDHKRMAREAMEAAGMDPADLPEFPEIIEMIMHVMAARAINHGSPSSLLSPADSIFLNEMAVRQAAELIICTANAGKLVLAMPNYSEKPDGGERKFKGAIIALPADKEGLFRSITELMEMSMNQTPNVRTQGTDGRFVPKTTIFCKQCGKWTAGENYCSATCKAAAAAGKAE